MIYVDPLMWHGWRVRGRHIKSCHMFTDGEIEELHLFAEKIGMKRAWFQNNRIPHYDLTPQRRRVAVAAGAKELTREKTVKLWRVIQGVLF